jgi:hypothetical protein
MKMDEYRLRCNAIGPYLAGKELVNRINELEKRLSDIDALREGAREKVAEPAREAVELLCRAGPLRWVMAEEPDAAKAWEIDVKKFLDSLATSEKGGEE